MHALTPSVLYEQLVINIQSDRFRYKSKTLLWLEKYNVTKQVYNSEARGVIIQVRHFYKNHFASIKISPKTQETIEIIAPVFRRHQSGAFLSEKFLLKSSPHSPMATH